MTDKIFLLQKDYLLSALDKVDRAMALSLELENLEDPDLIRSYMNNIDELMNSVDEDERIAQDIGDSLGHE